MQCRLVQFHNPQSRWGEDYAMINAIIGFLAGAMIMYFINAQPPITDKKPREIENNLVSSAEFEAKLDAGIEILKDEIKNFAPSVPDCPVIVDKPTSIREICINRMVYYVTNRGGISPRVTLSSQTYVECGGENIDTSFSSKIIPEEK
jgi:hypothetical protein